MGRIVQGQKKIMNEYTREEELFVISMMTWSFSRLNSFYTCPWEWRQKYIYDNTGIGGGLFADTGKFVHEIIEKYAKGELDVLELPLYFEENFNEAVPYQYPEDQCAKRYEQCLDYFNNFDLDITGQEILGIEKEVRFEYGGHEFLGFIDLLLRDKETGEITIYDHKSSNIKILKNGNISKSDKEHFDSFKRQLYLYSYPIIKEYGHVDKLKWNIFREQRFIEIPFDRTEYEAALQWALDTIHAIENETEWAFKESFMYCNRMCSQRMECPVRLSYKEQQDEDQIDTFSSY